MLSVLLGVTTVSAQSSTVLECTGTTKIGAHHSRNFPPEAFVRGEDNLLMIVIKDKSLSVDGAIFESKPVDISKMSEDVLTFDELKEMGTYFHGVSTYENGNAPSRSGVQKESALYILAEKKIYLSRLDGSFTYGESYYTHDLQNNRLGSLTRSKLKRGYVMQQVDGTCKKPKKERLF